MLGLRLSWCGDDLEVARMVTAEISLSQCHDLCPWRPHRCEVDEKRPS